MARTPGAINQWSSPGIQMKGGLIYHQEQWDVVGVRFQTPVVFLLMLLRAAAAFCLP